MCDRAVSGNTDVNPSYTFPAATTTGIRLYVTDDGPNAPLRFEEILVYGELLPDTDPIINLAPSDITTTSATFNARLQILNTNSDVYVYWGTSDGTNNVATWGDSDFVGSWTLSAQTNINYAVTGLSIGTTYYYTFRATNAVTNVWASPSRSFGTLDALAVAFVDDHAGAGIWPGDLVTYAVTFNRPITPDPVASDFGNAGSAAITVESVTKTSDAEYEVAVRPTAAGSLQLEIKSGVNIEDLLGNALATPAADEDVLTVNPPPQWEGELGVLEPSANGGINPQTGGEWAAGDTYHLAFVTSGTRDATDPDIEPYHAFVQSAASAMGWGDTTWYCILQTWNDPTRNVNAPPMSTPSAIILADGTTKLADNGPDLANGPDHTFSITEIGTSYSGAVASGSNRKPGDPNQPNIEHGVSWATDGRWWQQFNGAQSSQWHFYAISDTLTIQPRVSTGTTLIVR